MTHLKVGDSAPDFAAKDQNGNIIRLSDYKGSKLILYFYPRDNTSGCSAEACSLRDSYQDLKLKGYSIVGVSPDNEKSHSDFIAKHRLPFSLIADTDHKVAQDYGVWVEKRLFKTTYMGIVRTTFKIDENGIIEEVITKVRPRYHGGQLL
jgi:peroxiredoxin Q/BCP